MIHRSVSAESMASSISKIEVLDRIFRYIRLTWKFCINLAGCRLLGSNELKH